MRDDAQLTNKFKIFLHHNDLKLKVLIPHATFPTIYTTAHRNDTARVILSQINLLCILRNI